MHIQGIDYTRFLRERTSKYWKAVSKEFVASGEKPSSESEKSLKVEKADQENRRHKE